MLTALRALMLIGIVSFFWTSHAEADGPTDIQVVKGKCNAQSHIAEGPIGADLTKRQSRYFCDVAIISFFDRTSSHLMVQFSEKQSHHGAILGFAGTMDADGQVLEVDRVYLEPGKATPATDGACKFFFERKEMTSIVCGAKIDEGNRRTVPVVAFDAFPSGTSRQSTDQPPETTVGVPYNKTGVVNCSLPGTIIDFALDGRGGAQIARIESNYAPFRRAARQTRVWKAGVADRDGKRILILDNGHNTRIMVDLPDGKGMAFSGDGGVSDILCQVLVAP